MAFIEKGQEIDIEQIKSATILSDQALKKKHQFCVVKMTAFSWLSVPAHLTMKRL